MIAPDGTVHPNHHRYAEVRAEERLRYTLLAGEDGPKHADAWAMFKDRAGERSGATQVTLGMVFETAEAFRRDRDFGAQELGQQTPGKLARFVEPEQDA